jgi:vacuolar-type H+-ATPase subunit I/STV1
LAHLEEIFVFFPEISCFFADYGLDFIFVPFCTSHVTAFLRLFHLALAWAMLTQILGVLTVTFVYLPVAIYLNA